MFLHLNGTNAHSEYMKVKQEILDLINNPGARTRIAFAVGGGENNISLLIRRNSVDGQLTKWKFLKAIEKETGIAIDQILEEETVEAVK